MRKATTLIIILICVLFVFGEPIKSNLAASNISLVEAEEPFVNPYITDGLVAMWDAEWNTGTFRHDSHATIWRDCIEGAEITIVNTDPNIAFTWQQNFLLYEDNYNGARFPEVSPLLTMKLNANVCDIYNNGVGTFEIVCIRGDDAVGDRMYTSMGWVGNIAYLYQNPFFSNSMHFNVSSIMSVMQSLSATKNTLYLNGVRKRSNANNTIKYRTLQSEDIITFW